jgi:hypothetical protein
MALELGPCQVLFGASGSETDLGKTNGGVTVRISDDTVDLTSDQNGSSPEDTIITGTTVEVECQLAEIDLATLNKALQGQNATPHSSFVAGENKVGTSLKGLGKSLILKKFVNGQPSPDAKDWITFPAAAASSNVELSFDGSNQRVLGLTFKCFPKLVSANWGTAAAIDKTVTYYFGDETVIA